jgi:hypothetical protein
MSRRTPAGRNTGCVSAQGAVLCDPWDVLEQLLWAGIGMVVLHWPRLGRWPTCPPLVLASGSGLDRPRHQHAAGHDRAGVRR